MLPETKLQVEVGGVGVLGGAGVWRLGGGGISQVCSQMGPDLNWRNECIFTPSSSTSGSSAADGLRMSLVLCGLRCFCPKAPWRVSRHFGRAGAPWGAGPMAERISAPRGLCRPAIRPLDSALWCLFLCLCHLRAFRFVAVGCCALGFPENRPRDTAPSSCPQGRPIFHVRSAFKI